MALIVYPTADWNTFMDEATADAVIGAMVGGDAFTILSSEEKEAYLKKTALSIRLCPNITLPDVVTSDLELAQGYLTLHALSVDMLAYDPNERAVTSESVDVISVSYDAGMKKDADAFPPIVQDLLRQYGCSKSSGGFSQGYVGRS